MHVKLATLTACGYLDGLTGIATFVRDRHALGASWHHERNEEVLASARATHTHRTPSPIIIVEHANIIARLHSENRDVEGSRLGNDDSSASDRIAPSCALQVGIDFNWTNVCSCLIGVRSTSVMWPWVRC